MPRLERIGSSVASCAKLRGHGAGKQPGEGDMRRLLFLAAVGALSVNTVGCMFSEYSSNPNRRVNQLLNQSEDLRQAQNDWEHFWMLDQPSHLTRERVHGGIQ